MATPEMTVYAVWCEYTTPQGDFKILRKGTYASVEDAQIGLKFSLKGGHYAEMIIEGRDITPEFKGTLKVCNDVKYYDAIDDNPIRLYIWTKDLKGNTERLSIGSHESRGYRLHTLASASAAPRKQQAEECISSHATDKISDASGNSTYSDSGKSTPKTVDTPLTSPPSSPYGASDKFAPLALDEESLSSRLLEIAAKATVIGAQSAIKPAQEITTIESGASACSDQACKIAHRLPSTLKVETASASNKPITVHEHGYDAGSEHESEDDRAETESTYNSLSLRGVKDGRFGSRIALKVRNQTRRRFLTFLRRLSSVSK